MGRAIIPTEVRRSSQGGPIEVLTSSGTWIKWSLLSSASMDRTASMMRSAGHGGLLTSSEPFHVVLDRRQDGDGVPPREVPPIQGDDQPQDGDDQPQDGDNDQPQDGDNDSHSPPQTMEDMVRKIAGEMDDAHFQDKLPEIVNAVTTAAEAMMDDKLSGFSPKRDGQGGDLETLIVRIEVKTPKIETPKDGIFHKQFPTLVKLIAAGQHVYLPGPPGTGKSHAAQAAAEALGYRFASISLGPTTPESRLWGGMDANGRFHEPPLLAGIRYAMEHPDQGFVKCLDEMDNGHPGILATLNSLMANGWVTAPNGDVLTVGRNLVLIGAANTYGTGPTAEFAGRNKLDAATLDRFAYLPWDTDLGVEKALVRQYLDPDSAEAWLDVWRTCRKNANDNGLKVFVTMRGAVNGARLVASGIEPRQALDLVLLNKLPDDQRRKVYSPRLRTKA